MNKKQTNIAVEQAAIIIARTATPTRDIDIGILSVCPSVRPSHCGIVSKLLNMSSRFLQPTHSSYPSTSLNVFAKFRRQR